MPAEHYGFPTIHEAMREASTALSKPTDVPRVFHEAREDSDRTLLFQVKLRHDLYRKFIGTVDEIAENKLYFASSLEDARVSQLLEKIDANTVVFERGVNISLSIQDMYDLQKVVGEYQVLVSSRNPMIRDEYGKFKETMEKAFSSATDSQKKKRIRTVLRVTKKILSHRMEL